MALNQLERLLATGLIAIGAITMLALICYTPDDKGSEGCGTVGAFGCLMWFGCLLTLVVEVIWK